jgi:ActR/RegA family two-component response regulator
MNQYQKRKRTKFDSSRKAPSPGLVCVTLQTMQVYQREGQNCLTNSVLNHTIKQQTMTTKNRLLFIVNRDPLVGNFLKYQLSGAGYKESVVFNSARECLYVLRKGTIPAFIIADYDLGSMNGEDFLKIIVDNFPDIRILFFSSMENHALAAQLIQKGASDYIHRTNTSNQAISELIKNLRYLEKEMALTGS